MVVRVDPAAIESVMTIPQKLLPKVVLGFDEPAEQPKIGVGRSVVAGLAMSLAITGIFLTFRGRKSRAIMMLVVCCAAILAATRMFADLAVPHPTPKPIGTSDRKGMPLLFPLRTAAKGDVVVKIVPEGDKITLVLAGARSAESCFRRAGPWTR